MTAQDSIDFADISSYPIGFFHIDIAEVRTEQGKLQMFVAIDTEPPGSLTSNCTKRLPPPYQESSCYA